MAKPEQTEKPTPKRQREARGKGQIAKSQDLGSAAIFTVIVIALHIGFLTTLSSAAHGFAVAFAHAGDADEPTIHSIWGLFARSAMAYISILTFAFVAAVAIALAVNLLQFGLLFTPNLIFPKFSKINPLTGFQRMFFSSQTFVNLLKQLVKLGLVIVLVYLGVKDHIATFYALGNAPPQMIITTIESLIYNIAIRFGIVLVILGVADYAWQKRQLDQSLKMSKQEVKDEGKQAEGSPEVRQAIKQRQRQSARRRMMAAVPRATSWSRTRPTSPSPWSGTISRWTRRSCAPKAPTSWPSASARSPANTTCRSSRIRRWPGPSTTRSNSIRPSHRIFTQPSHRSSRSSSS